MQLSTCYTISSASLDENDVIDVSFESLSAFGCWYTLSIVRSKSCFYILKNQLYNLLIKFTYVL